MNYQHPGCLRQICMLESRWKAAGVLSTSILSFECLAQLSLGRQFY